MIKKEEYINIFFISIPLADGKQAQKQGFEEYKNSTRMLLPIKRFKKN